ncbi:MAG: xylanase [Noviherbaspirillum sp.]
MPFLVLKVDVDTWRGTREGVPRLARLLRRQGAGATFLFSLGPDHTGWALRRAFRPGFFGKVARTSVVEHYGWKTLMYGVLLPAPDIGLDCATEMRAVRDDGFGCGIHAWDHVLWQDNVRWRDAAWTRRQMRMAWERYAAIFGEAPHTHGAAGWQMNAHAYTFLDEMGMPYASDGRCRLDPSGALLDHADGPYRLRLAGGMRSCLQLPTTLPTLDELLGRRIGDRLVGPDTLDRELLRLTEAPRDHVFTLHAELEGQRLAPAFDRLLAGWRSQGYTLASLGDYYRSLQSTPLPACGTAWGELPGRSGQLAVRSA